jgi:putative methionine-R-sulfoxide reductase with GAF domain
MVPLIKNIQATEGLRALAVVPVLHQGQVVAVLNMASHTHDEISEPARHALEAIAALGLLFNLP